MTRAALATASGLDRTAIWRLEAGTRTKPSTDTLHAIALALGVPITAISHLGPAEDEPSEAMSA